MKKLLITGILLIGGLGWAQPPSPSGPIIVLTIEGVINPVIGDYISGGIREAEQKNAEAVLIEMNTPGGLLDATRTTISAMINSPIPIIVYVAPRGSRATSAGVFITMASDIAAMAPETHIGAAHPVTIGGNTPDRPQEKQKNNESDSKTNAEKTSSDKKSSPQQSSSVMEEKMVSDASAYIRTLAKERKRNADWAERAVRESVSLTAEEALKENVIEIIAGSREELVDQIDQKKVSKNGRDITLNLKGAPFEKIPMTPTQKLLHMIAHPNVAYILMMLGVYGLIYELSSPGIGLGGAVGAICLLLAFFSLQVLPINTVGIILIVVGILCLVLELFTPTNGLLTIGGLISFALGSFFLIDVPKDFSIPRVSLGLILPTVIVTGLLFGFALKKVMAARRNRPSVGVESMIGARGITQKDFKKNGMIFVNGELWKAKSKDKLNAGDEVEVVQVNHTILIVKKVK